MKYSSSGPVPRRCSIQPYIQALRGGASAGLVEFTSGSRMMAKVVLGYTGMLVYVGSVRRRFETLVVYVIAKFP